MKPVVTALLSALIILSCSNKPKYIYATLDFSDSLKPHLEKIIESGIAGYDSSTLYLKEHATDSELNKLSRSEHPVLRMVTLRIMQQRDSLDPLGFIMSHLDDNATVAIDEGEFGINFRKIPDVLLQDAEWKTIEERNKTVEKVLLEHNNLHAAYTILTKLDAKEKYYRSIKEMALRDIPFEEIEYALFGLAKFKKKADIPFIKKKLRENSGSLNELSFQTMKEFPDSSYLSILINYGKKWYFLHSVAFQNDAFVAKKYFEAIASYKRKEVADIFPLLLERTIQIAFCAQDFKDDLYEAFWKNRCEAYSSIIPLIKPRMEEIKKWRFEIEKINHESNVGKTTFYWWSN